MKNQFSRILSVSLLSLALTTISGCANRNKADIVDTGLEKQAHVTAGQGESVGVRDKEFVLQKKKNLGEELRRLEENVRELDDRVYGNRDFDTYGIWGKLRDCRNSLKEKNSDFDPGSMERVSDSEYLLNWKANSDAKAAIEKSSEKLVAMSEEDLDDHIKKLNKVKSHLQEREDEINDKLSRCRSIKP